MKIQDIPKMTDEEIEAYLEQGEFHTQGHQIALQEYNRRKLSQLSKPHWTRNAIFWVSVIAALAAVVAAGFGYLQWSQAPKSAHPVAQTAPAPETRPMHEIPTPKQSHIEGKK